MNATLAQITSRAAAATAAHQLEHTTAAVHELARIYGFDASEALQKLELAAPAPAREDVLARLLADTDPAPAKVTPKRPTTSPKRSPKQSQEKKLQKTAEKEQKAAAKAAEKEQKAAEKAALRVEKQAQKALAKFVKLAEKAEKDAQKAAAKAEKEALKAQKEALKAEKAAKREENQALKAKRLAEREARAAEKAKTAPEKTDSGLEEEEMDVQEFEFEGITYLRGPSGEMFDAESHDPVGWWNEADRCISPEQPAQQPKKVTHTVDFVL